ncbi:MAG: beta-lactamase family protein [Ruminococcaceae bacterium]|nr:beta-lactamase family protein [Oscillospiraceae bacterium]
MDFSSVIAFIENEIRGNRGVPGCDFQVMQDHEVLFRYRSGTSDEKGVVPVSGQELYYMYSCTKPITCTAGMQLVEQGRLLLDAPVSTYLPEFRDAFVLKDGQPTAPSRTMTVRHLFTMSAGFDYNWGKPPLKALLATNPHANTRTVVGTFIQSPLVFDPGERFQYSLCHDVLAAVIEVAAGMTFSDYLKRSIFEPLGMTHTGFFPTEAETAAMAAQFLFQPPHTITPMEKVNSFRITDAYESGGAGLYSCLDDYARFADAMANGGIGVSGASILKPETIDQMRAPQLTKYLINDAFSIPAGPGYGYGLGVRTLIDRSRGQRSAIGEFGWDGAAGSYLMMDPTHRLSIVFLMHVRNWVLLLGHSHAALRDLTYEALGL